MTIHKNYSTELRSFKLAAGTKFDLKTLKSPIIDFFVTLDGATALTGIVFTESLGSVDSVVPLERLVFNINDIENGYIVPNSLVNLFNTTIVPAGGQLNVGIFKSAQHDEIKCSVDCVIHFKSRHDETM